MNPNDMTPDEQARIDELTSEILRDYDIEAEQLQGVVDLDHINSEICAAANGLGVLETLKDEGWRLGKDSEDRITHLKLKIFEIVEFNINKLYSTLP